MPPRPYRLAFYVDARGDSPVERWLPGTRSRRRLRPRLGHGRSSPAERPSPVRAPAPVRELAGRRPVRVPVPGLDRRPAPATREEGSPEPARGPAEGSVPRLLPPPRRQGPPAPRRLRQGQAFEPEVPERPDPACAQAPLGLACSAPPEVGGLTWPCIKPILWRTWPRHGTSS